MQTVTLQVNDNFMQEFLNYIDNQKEHIYIENDPNLAYDPYFYERQKQLHQTREDIKSGKIKMIENDEFWNDIDAYVESLQQ
jgi:hypothetical protein